MSQTAGVNRRKDRRKKVTFCALAGALTGGPQGSSQLMVTQLTAI